MKEKFIIKESSPLSGTVQMSGYKNSAGPILAATILCDTPCTIDNIPLITDVLNLIKILEEMGAKVEWIEKKKIKIDTSNINPHNIPFEIFEKMRVSVLLIGPLLSKFKEFKVPHPGGDKIGLRPIITHLDAFKKLGVQIIESNNNYTFRAPEKEENRKVALREFSVTATENIMMLASRIQATTKIEIAACEPQVNDLADFLRKTGVEVEGDGTHTIIIKGKQKLSGVDFSICYDPTEAGTFLIAFAVTQGEGIIENVNPNHLTFFLERMKDIGVNFITHENSIEVKKSENLEAAKIQVLPYPGFPTDLQPQISVLLTQAVGKSLIHDPLYEDRFLHLRELRKMGADIEITDPHRALIFGKTNLVGNKIVASDIRTGGALIIAALIAEGSSQISNVHQIDRGYENFDEKLRKLGANIERRNS